MNRDWGLVIIAGLIEIIWALGLKFAESWYMWAAVALLICLSFAILLKATERLPVATVYAVFTGIGTAGTVLAEIFFFGEPFSWPKAFFLLLLLSGVIGLKLVTGDRERKMVNEQ